MIKKEIPKTAYLLSVSRLISLDDDTNLRHVTFNIGIFEKERDLFRVMRIIRENNSENVKLHFETITNPRYIDSTDKSLTFKLF